MATVLSPSSWVDESFAMTCDTEMNFDLGDFSTSINGLFLGPVISRSQNAICPLSDSDKLMLWPKTPLLEGVISGNFLRAVFLIAMACC